MYLDSAIVVKLLVRETDSDWFDCHLVGHNFETSELALAEVRSALLAKERNGTYSAARARGSHGKVSIDGGRRDHPAFGAEPLGG